MLVSCRVFGGVLVEKNMIFHQHVFFFKYFFKNLFFFQFSVSCLLVYFLLVVGVFWYTFLPDIFENSISSGRGLWKIGSPESPPPKKTTYGDAPGGSIFFNSKCDFWENSNHALNLPKPSHVFFEMAPFFLFLEL